LKETLSFRELLFTIRTPSRKYSFRSLFSGHFEQKLLYFLANAPVMYIH